MATKKKSGNGTKTKGKQKEPKATAANGDATKEMAKPQQPTSKPLASAPAELEPLRKKVEEAKTDLTKAQNEANALRLHAKALESVAKKAYIEALMPYRDACKRTGAKCEFAGGRAANRAPAVRFLVERVDGGVKVAIKGRAETEEVIPQAALDASITKAAFAYVDRVLGTRDVIGFKGAYVKRCSYVVSLSSSAGESRNAA